MKKFVITLFILLLCSNYSFAFNNKKITGYKKSETISLDDFLYAKDAPENWKHLGINANGDVIYKNKVIINNCGQPVNNTTAAESYLLLKILIIAEGAEPKEGCDTSDTYTNGIYGLGCYIYESD